MATAKAKNPRAISIATMIFRRSNRSVITPAGNVKTNQGKRDATMTSAIKSGDRVTADANHG